MKSKALDLLTRITMFMIFPMLIISLIIYLTGFRGPIQLDQTYYNFMQQVVIRSNSWNVKIPSIPLLDKTNKSGADFFSAIIDFVNFLIRIVNVVIMVTNMIISIFITLGAIISLLFEYFGDLIHNNTRGSQPIEFWNSVGFSA